MQPVTSPVRETRATHIAEIAPAYLTRYDLPAVVAPDRSAPGGRAGERPERMRFATAARRTAAAVLAGAALVATVGCGEVVVDNERLEGAIERSAADAGVAHRVADVDCPDRARSETGHRFDCTLTRTDGGTEAIPVEVTDGASGKVDFGNAVR